MLSDAETLDRLRHIHQVVRETASAMPLQDDYLRSIGCSLAESPRMG